MGNKIIMKNKSIFKISASGIALALIIVVQFLGKLLPSGFVIWGPVSLNQLITGSFVNMILILITIRAGIYSALATGLLSSVMAFLLQIGPIFPQLVIFIAMSNLILVSVFYLLSFLIKPSNKKYMLVISVIISGVTKFLFLKFTIPWSLSIINNISKTQISVLSVMFSWPQLVTSLVGGLLALFINSRIAVNINGK